MVEEIACVYKTGGDYNLEYVRRLYESVKEYSDRPFVCLSDDPNAEQFCDRLIILKNNWPGWWSKLELFEHLHSALYFDLDTVIKQDITDICDHNHKFTMLKGFIWGRNNSGVMAWNGDYSYITKAFNPKVIPRYSVMRESWGDQDFITDNLRIKAKHFQDIFLNKIASRKVSSRGRIKKASVVCFHGKPRPHQVGWNVYR